MNFIVIMSDTLRRDYLGCNGNTWVKTPVLDEFAKSAVAFDKAYAASFPTVLNRADLMTGRFAFPFMGWEPLPRQLPTLAQTLTDAGYVTMLITDTPHTLQNGFHYDRGFSAWQWIRGQESDRVRTDFMEEDLLPCSPEKLRQREKMRRLHYLNAHFRRNERDTFVAQTMSAAADWLEANHQHERFFLFVDTFDPHEPWDAPDFYLKMYEKEYRGDNVSYPDYVPVDRYTRQEINHCRALYAAEVTLVDTWIGEVLRKVDRLGLADKTAVLILSDHGFYFGEHNYIGKFSTAAPIPIYDEVAGTVAMARVPGAGFRRGERSSALVQPPDLAPTLLDLAGLKIPPWAEGRSMGPVLRKRGKGDNGRKIAVTSSRLIESRDNASWEKGGYASITDGEWTLMYGGAHAPSELYHTARDKGQTRNVIAGHPAIARRLHREWAQFLESINVEERLLAGHRAEPRFK